MSKIDIIIPCYKGLNTLSRTLHSIAMQNHVEDCNVIIVDDCCPEVTKKNSYKIILNKFKEFGIKGKVIRNKTNLGPGLSRQVGIDNGKSPYITFIDCGDTFLIEHAIDIFISALDDGLNCYFSRILSTREFVSQPLFPWVIGCAYKRKFLTENKIRFPSFRCMEDVAFNDLVRVSVIHENPFSEFYLYNYNLYNWTYDTNNINREGYVYDMGSFYYYFTWRYLENHDKFNEWMTNKDTKNYIYEVIYNSVISTFYYFQSCHLNEYFYNSAKLANQLIIKRYWQTIRELMGTVNLGDIYRNNVKDYPNFKISFEEFIQYCDNIYNDENVQDNLLLYYNVWSEWERNPSMLEEMKSNVNSGAAIPDYWKPENKFIEKVLESLKNT